MFDTTKKFIMNFNELIKYIGEKRSVIFDLDNTLYDENIFLFKVYDNIALHINKFFNINKDLVFHFLKKTFLNEGRKCLLEKMLMEFELKARIPPRELLVFFRNEEYFHDFSLNIFPQYADFLFTREYCLITNGNVLQQKLKLNLLSLHKNTNIKQVIYADAYGGKPSIQSFCELKKKVNLINPVYIGDSDIDRQFANNAEIEFVKVELELDNDGSLNEHSLRFIV